MTAVCSSGRPAMRTSCLGEPKRVEAPAASTMANSESAALARQRRRSCAPAVPAGAREALPRAERHPRARSGCAPRESRPRRCRRRDASRPRASRPRAAPRAPRGACSRCQLKKCANSGHACRARAAAASGAAAKAASSFSSASRLRPRRASAASSASRVACSGPYWSISSRQPPVALLEPGEHAHQVVHARLAERLERRAARGDAAAARPRAVRRRRRPRRRASAPVSSWRANQLDLVHDEGRVLLEARRGTPAVAPPGERARVVHEGVHLCDDRQRDRLGRAAAERQPHRRVQPAAQPCAHRRPSSPSSCSRRAAGPEQADVAGSARRASARR